MARSIGIDIGSYSVKVVLASAGFRQSHAVDYIERIVPGGAGPDYDERAAAVVGEILREHATENDNLYLAVPGRAVHSRVLEFPFKGLKRQDLEKAVGAELEGLLPFDLDDIAFAFDSLPRDLGEAPDPAARAPQMALAADDEPTFVQGTGEPMPPRGAVAPPASGMRVFACAMQLDRARRMLDLIKRHAGEEPRGLIVGSAVYASFAERIGALSHAQQTGSPVAVIDMGHSQTSLCVVRGARVIFARTLTYGGRDVTEAIARTWQLPFDEAETAKHSDGFIASSAEPPPSEQWRRIHEVVRVELEPIARELRRTLMVCRAETGGTAVAAVLVGGASRLRGLPSFLSEQLEIPVSTLAPGDAEHVLGKELAAEGVPADVAATAAGTAFEGASGRPALDLRTGELAFKADFSFLRAKATHLAAAALIMIAFAAGNAYASLYKLRKAEEVLTERLALETVQVLGKQMDAPAVLAQVSPKAREQSPLPKMTAYDILLEINGKLPGKSDVKLDVREIDIRPGKVTIQATAASSKEIDKIKEALATVECFEDVTEGGISNGPDGMNFSMTITTKCM